MSFVQTLKYRDLMKRREKLELEQYFPPIHHLIFLIDDYVAKKIKLEELRMEQARLEDKIDCAKEFVRVIQGRDKNE